MLKDKSVLIVEDDMLLGMGLATAVEDLGGQAVGPISTVSEARSLIVAGAFTAAILDANLEDRNVSPLALELLDKGVPFLIYTGVGLPTELAAAYPHISVLMKPVPPQQVVEKLAQQLGRFERPQPTMPIQSGKHNPPESEEVRNQKLQAVADSLISQLGDRAELIAERQLSHATGDILSTWETIAGLIRDKMRA